MATGATDYRVLSGGQLRGDVIVPGDKSISHRAVMLASIANGTSHVRGLLQGEDVLRTIDAFRALGVAIEGPDAGAITVSGVGPAGLVPSEKPIDLGNSGTAMRLLMGLLAGQGVTATLTGDASLSRRPMERVAQPLRLMGAQIVTSASGTPPVQIAGVSRLSGTSTQLTIASAQLKSALLLAGLGASGETCVTEIARTRDHTERMLQGFGVQCKRDGLTVCVQGGAVLTAQDIDVPADLSSAAFFIVGATLAGDEITLPAVGVNPTRTGIVDILNAMGARIEQHDPRIVCGEPVADLRVAQSSLTGIEIDPDLVPLAIDEFPVLCVAAAAANGMTVISGAEELRHKESDRIAVMAQGLKALGVNVQEKKDGMVIHGGAIRGGTVDSHGDHRIAMAFCIAALVAQEPIHVRDCANIATSFPGFRDIAALAGLRFE